MSKRIALALALMCAPLATWAAQFVEGTHYMVVSDKPATETPVIKEFFSLYCGHCYNMEKRYLPLIKPGLDKSIDFQQAHVDFMNSEIGTEVILSLAVMQEMGVEDKVKKPLFGILAGGDHHHGPGEAHDPETEDQIKTRSDIKKVFTDNGVDVADYDKIAASDAVKSKVTAWMMDQQKFRIQSVPTFVVNDKYMINMSQIRTLSELTELMNYLATEK
ncbi:thiol:disulfide interchange protein DsbA/DsbL [Ferrimonas sediminicola]|uniref:Thiol:disulfide interchange protein n=1 Tax=Ferrimonas sediminicola TaxID=2569538 RepID=A0A4U1BIP1_9GAMM|nr:thiol:disulfide interchange protein DsbA/DsbL [Ferrimonas sediminicola]TKB50985.1 thiol:disulfide interchange protein DsbA/DsbL [Ferrimonas sediminicola]